MEYPPRRPCPAPLRPPQALAVLLGVPAEKNYFYTTAMDPWNIDSNNPHRTKGLGSGFSDYAKDCGCVRDAGG